MLNRIFLPIMIILIGLSSCAQGSPVSSTPEISSGIEGQVTEGPMCPGPVRIGVTGCADQHYQANISVLDANNTQITQFQTDSVGYFKVSLTPGTYILHPESGKPVPRAADQTVVVKEGEYTQLSILYDTGMR